MKTIRLTSPFSLLAAGALAFSVSLFNPPAASAGIDPRPRDLREPRVQIALLLDTSNSMDGLIDQARSRLWRIVNELSSARCDGMRPRLEVALYEYGNNRLSRDSDYIREVCQFTSDLDLISQNLFSLRTNGGDEYCGAVIDRALRDLDWSHHSADLRMIFIAGNEPFTQGPVDFRPVVRRAAARGITVNTIFCGPDHEGVVTNWETGATLAGGTYASINQDYGIPHIDAPQDRALAALNDRLNRTYLAYGERGRARAEMQRAQDSNAAASAPSSFAGRVSAKASSLYRNSSWDLVDATREGEVDLAELEREELPEALRGLSVAEQKKKIDDMARERAEVRQRIQELSEARERHVAAELKKLAAPGDAALDEAILKSVRDQAAQKNYVFTR
ncbi:MAG: VWA domain-containing protein [Opitutaceae bacterium]